MPWPGVYTASNKRPVLEMTAITILSIRSPRQMEGPTVARGNNYGSRTWSGGTIGGAVFCPAGQLAARTTYGVTVPAGLHAN